jgi:stage V sporulation protein B
MGMDKFFKNSLILTLSNLTTGILGFIFSIILSRELGPEGMGLYGLIMPVYNLFICLICGGIITAISKIAAEYTARNDYKNLKKTIKTTLSFNIIWSLIIVFLVFIFSSQISNFMIKDTRTLNALRLTCPAMLFISLSNTLKGYFYGTSKISIPAFIDISEKAVRICVIVVIIQGLQLKNTADTVTGAYAALCIGELISLLLLYLYYKLDIKKQHFSYNKAEGRVQLLFNVLIISLPLCINGFVSTALSTLSTLIVPRRIVSAGIEYSSALSMIGKFTGMSLSIVFFPIIIVSSISTVLIPDLSQSLSKKDYYTIENRIYEVLRISLLLGLSCLVICLTIPESLGVMFFNRSDLGGYIKFASISAPLAYVASTTFGILNGLGKQNLILRNSLIVSVLEVILLYILTAIPSINIYGYGISLFTTSALIIALNLHEIKKNIHLVIMPFKIFIDILISILVYFILSTLCKFIPNNIFVLKNIIIIAAGFGLIFFLSYFCKRKAEY